MGSRAGLCPPTRLPTCGALPDDGGLHSQEGAHMRASGPGTAAGQSRAPEGHPLNCFAALIRPPSNFLGLKFFFLFLKDKSFSVLIHKINAVLGGLLRLWLNPSKGHGPKSPTAVDKGLPASQQPLGPRSPDWREGPGEPHQPVLGTADRRRSLSCLLSLPLFDRGGSGVLRGRLSVHRGHLAMVQAELLGLETEAGDTVGHVDSRGCGA